MPERHVGERFDPEAIDLAQQEEPGDQHRQDAPRARCRPPAAPVSIRDARGGTVRSSGLLPDRHAGTSADMPATHETAPGGITLARTAKCARAETRGPSRQAAAGCRARRTRPALHTPTYLRPLHLANGKVSPGFNKQVDPVRPHQQRSATVARRPSWSNRQGRQCGVTANCYVRS